MIFDQIKEIGVVPVIAIEQEEKALPLADALLAGGLPVAEITFRTSAAEKVIEIIARERPEMLVGAGTVLTIDQLHSAKQAGALFALAPGLDTEIVKAAQACDLPFAPGVMTPSEIQAAVRAGCLMMKFFPAHAAGGPKMLNNISAPFRHLSLTFNPTGGVNIENMPEWLENPSVVAVGGTWIATSEDIAEGNWKGIEEKARKAVEKVKLCRT